MVDEITLLTISIVNLDVVAIGIRLANSEDKISIANVVLNIPIAKGDNSLSAVVEGVYNALPRVVPTFANTILS